jgi:hypothetical protein
MTITGLVMRKPTAMPPSLDRAVNRKDVEEYDALRLRALPTVALTKTGG